MTTKRHPGWITRASSGVLGVLRDGGAPFLRGADDATLRAFALGLRTAVRRSLARPIAAAGAGEELPDDGFTTLAGEDAVALLTDNAEAFETKCRMVEAAVTSVDCALYYLADDATGRRFAHALVQAAGRGVRVRLAVDAAASEEKHYALAGYHRAADRGALVVLDHLRRAGVDVHVLGSDRFCMHRKFLLVDGTRCVFGGRNIADHYALPGWRDLELLLFGPIARSFAGAVAQTFEAPALASPAVPGLVVGVPGHRGRAFASALRNLIERAERTLDIEHAYVLSHDWLDRALRDAVRAGVRVRLFTNSAASNDLPYITWRMAVTLEALRKAGVAVHLRCGAGATLHTKLAVADGRRVLFGSSNLDYYSPVYCAELDLAIDDASLGAALVAVFEEGLGAPSTAAVVPGSVAHADLLRTCRPWCVSRAYDFLLHDFQ